MTEHQSSSTSGWLGALGRIFSGSSSSQNETKERVDNNSTTEKNARDNSSNLNGSRSFQSNTSSGKGLRYLNTPIVETRTSLDISRPAPLADSFSQSRKRMNDEFRAPVETDISSLSAKRFRGLANHSLLEEPIRVNVSERLDSTWNGVSALESSPSSLRSLKSRMSEVPSTTSSGLSSKTRAILQQLERVHTPAKDARKLPTMRTTGASTEKWASIQNSNLSCGTPPPLKKTMGSVPSRIQLLSSRIGTLQRKPYWRDIVRAPKIHTETNEANKANKDTLINPISSNYKTITPLFDIDESSPPKEKKKDMTEVRKPQPVLKGSDGKATNVFSAKELEDDNITPLPSVPAVSLPQFSVPAKGFLDDIVFSFAPPKENKFENGVLCSSKEVAEDETSSDSDESVSDDSVNSSSSETSVEEQSDKSEKKESRPPTSTDSESSATPFSSKSISPQNRDSEKSVDNKTLEKKDAIAPAPKPEAKVPVAASATWSCPDCFVSNKSSDAKCVCCGHVNKANIVEEKRVDWDCPDCFVKNTGSMSKCQCCGFVKYKTAASTSDDNVFGDKAFKPQSFGSGFSFGVTSSTTSSASQPAFGFSATSSTVSSNATTNSTAPTFPFPTSFGVGKSSVETKPADAAATVTSSLAPTPVFGTKSTAPSVVSKPLFGSTDKPLFGSTDKDKVDKAPVFGASLKTEKPVFGASPLSTFSSTVPTKSPFASTETTKPAEGAPLFGSLKTSAASTAPFPSLSLGGFGTSTDNSSPFDKEVKKDAPVNLFGGLSSSSAASTVPAAVPTPAPAAAPAVTAALPTIAPSAPASGNGFLFSKEGSNPLFGSSSLSLGTSKPATEPSKLGMFGQGSGLFNPVATSAAPAPAPAPAPASTGSVPTFAGLTTTTNPTGNLFGNSTSLQTGFNFQTPGGEEKKPLFGGSDASKLFSTASSSKDDVPAAKKPFSSSSATGATPFSFGQSKPANESAGLTGNIFGNNASQGFGGSNSTPSFGASAWGSSEQAPPSLSASSSSNSLFSSNPEISKGFQFGAATQPTGASQMFQFGQPTIGNSTFNFGGGNPAPAFSAQPNPPAVSMFQGSNDSALGGAFAFQGSTAGGPTRKLATARRRMGKK
ncbi:unnamed protein product [Auanema sp. JU1783]|nr:unnamed protein product [Auanema sp. JU1783]